MCVIILICILVFFPVHDSGVGSGWNSGGSGRSDVSVVYNTVTPMSCDCSITIVNSCLLSFLPGVGCAIAVSSIPGASTVGIFSYV